VTVRGAVPEDLPALTALASSPAVAPFLATNASERIAGALQEPDETLLALEVDGRLAGAARLVLRVPRHRLAEVRSLMLVPTLRGQGLGTAAVAAIAGVAFGAHGVHRLEGEVLAHNTAGLRAFENAGFTREGVRRRAWHRDGTWQDSVLLGLLEDEPAR
jgi:RimJ/RimL family protein N-acetyltransferase